MPVVLRTANYDGVAELLIPFVQSKNSNISNEIIFDNYRLASPGKLSSETFWENMGLSQNLEDKYLESSELVGGVIGRKWYSGKRGII